METRYFNCLLHCFDDQRSGLRPERAPMNTLLHSAMVTLFALLGVAAFGAAEQPAVRVVVDPRVELCCVVFRLAGNPEYNMGRIETYTRDVDAYFAAHREHAAVKLARQLRDTRGVSFDACMSIAVHLNDIDKVELRVPWEPRPAALDSRWVASEAREFLGELRKFAAETRFHEFLAAHRELYETAEQRMRDIARSPGTPGMVSRSTSGPGREHRSPLPSHC